MQKDINISTFTAAINAEAGYAFANLEDMREECAETRDTIADFKKHNELLSENKTNHGVFYSFRRGHSSEALVMDFGDYRLAVNG